ncbi:MAG: hypothetical protein II639_06210, partial [Clostridia bacterium]|nr:hypothetical protein [Clostridia bacterium]
MGLDEQGIPILLTGEILSGLLGHLALEVDSGGVGCHQLLLALEFLPHLVDAGILFGDGLQLRLEGAHRGLGII